MATLTETAYYSRKVINWSIVALVVLILVRWLFYIAVDAWRQAHPAPPYKVNNYFGKLPRIVFPPSASASGQLSFSVQTISGDIPQITDMAKVYFMPKNRSGFLSLAKAQEKVSKIGFTTTPRQISSDVYRWVDLKTPLRSLEMNIVNEHYTLSYAYIHDLTLFSQRQIPSAQQASKETIDFLIKMDMLPKDVNTADAQISFLKLVGNQFETTTSQSQADAVRVDLFRQKYDNLPVLTENPKQGLISFVISGSRNTGQRFLSVKYDYWPINVNTTGVYNLKPSSQAWSELQSGAAYFALLSPNSTQVAITNVYLAYYDSKELQLFMQPVYVFEGDPQFLAYVPAVTSDWVESD